VRALLWPLFPRSAWALPATVLEGTTGDGAALASFVWSTWSQPATVVADTTGVGAALASVRTVGVASCSHCGGVHYS
jgi:hypothetical protein